jgi:uncharacterized repeat protein (TIGR03803 family)
MRIHKVFAIAAGLLLCCGGAQAGSGWHARVLTPLCPEVCPGGTAPGPLLTDSAGHLYGTLSTGGVNGGGSVFALTQKTGRGKWTMHSIYNFCAELNCRDGSVPARSGLIADADGNLYGTTFAGGAKDRGVFFKLTPNPNRKHWILTVLYDFCSHNSACTDGGSPQGTLAYQGQAQGLPYDGVSTLYGAAEQYGAHGQGTVFSLSPAQGAWRLKVLYAFCGEQGGPDCSDGMGPYGVTLDPAGNLYGVANGGIRVSQFSFGGVLFKLSPVVGQRHWGETVLHSFCSLAACADGAEPAGTPILDAEGNLLGMTFAGGSMPCDDVQGCGTLYKVTPDGSESVLYNFCALRKCHDGRQPAGALTQDLAGTLYGVTQAGGSGDNDFNHFGGGTVFSFAGGVLTTLHGFCKDTGCPDGEYPNVGVTLDAAGNVYGTTQAGGPTQTGEVFVLKP